LTDTAIASISALELHELVTAPEEFALVDVREAGATAEQGSILLAISVPLSRLELRIDGLIPRRSTRVIVYSSRGEALAERGAQRLTDLGYTNVEILDGGVEAWGEAGYKIQSGGDHVIGQAFGEWIEDVYETPHISVPDYRSKVESGEDIVLLDSRPLPEYERHSLPGGTSIPGSELVYRARELVTSPDSLVVVHCAGRTRSILGAQVLINAGLPNRVVSLEGGTQSWVLEGHELDHGKSSEASAPGPEALAAAQESALRIAHRFDAKYIDKRTLEQFRAEAHERTLYLLDVRPPEEFVAGHLPGSISAPSWDVAPWVFRYVGTHNSRVVLIDNDQVRATVAASWINQIGWAEVFVLQDALSAEQLESGPVPRGKVLGLPESGYELISPAQLDSERTSGADVAILDLQPSTGVTVLDPQATGSYRQGHVPGASFAIRSRLVDTVDEIPGEGRIVLVSEDDTIARFAAAELAEFTSRPVAVLEGGIEAWQKAGLALESDAERFLHTPDDLVRSGWRETDPEEQKAGFRWYLGWELGLPAQLREDDTVPFRTFA
jgi:rhodanese-related sulfurtransferase